MKKMYLKPEIEAAQLHSTFALLSGTPVTPTEKPTDPPVIPGPPSTPGGGSAPRRRVF